jgi:isocitrate dehydrogenase kinase/phosphatase
VSNRHYRLFRKVSAHAQARFEAANWLGQQRAQRERIEFYDQRVLETCAQLKQTLGLSAGASTPFVTRQTSKLW